jgi:TRAP-type C4-dicarboxylate transport system permease small subunit
VEGLIVLVAYTVIASIGEAFAIGIGFFLDKMSPAASTIVFMVNSAIILGLAWPIALRVTRP